MLNSVLEYDLHIPQPSEIMALSLRHTKRLLAAYRRDGPAALAHGNRERRPHNAVPKAAAAAVVALAGKHYTGANHTHLTELLREREGIDLSRPTVRRILTRAGIGSPRSLVAPHSTGFGGDACPRRACWCRSTAVTTTGSKSGARILCSCWRWMTPPMQWPKRSSAPLKTPEATWCSLRASSDSGESRWPCTAIGIRPSSTMPAELSLSETISLKYTRKVARDNTLEYQWRALQLLTRMDRPNYAGLQVEVLERADGRLMIMYHGVKVDFQESP